MENYNWDHAPNPQYNLRLPQKQPGSTNLGVPGSSLEQWINAHPTNPREDAIKDVYKKWNPQWDEMLDNAPKELRNKLKKIRETGMGSEISRQYMTDPAIQAAMQGNGIQESLAMDRMYSYAGSYGGSLGINGSRQAPTNPASMIEQNNLRIAGTGQFQNALYENIYKKNPGDPNSKTMASGNPAFTNGMRPADVMNMASYASKYGGVMSTMNFEGKTETNVGNKVAHVQKMAQGMGEFMKIMGSKDVSEALQQIRNLEGKEFARINPEAFANKMKNVTKFAAAANIGAADMLDLMSRGKGVLDASSGRGEGSGYEGGSYMVRGKDKNGNETVGFQQASTVEEGMSAAVTQKTLAVAGMRGITDKTEIAKMDYLRQKRQGRIGNTTGGRAIELAIKLRAAGKISKETYDRFEKAASTGVGMKEAVAEISEKSGLRMDDVIMNEGRYNAENYSLDKQIVARNPGNATVLEELGAEAVSLDDKKYAKDSGMHMAQTKADEQRKVGRDLASSYGVKFSKEQTKAQEREAMTRLRKGIADGTIKVADKQAYLNKIDQAMSKDVSMDVLEQRLGRMGPEGKTLAATARSGLEEIKYENVLGSEEYKLGMSKELRTELNNEMTDAGIVNGFGKGTNAQKDANARAAIADALKNGVVDPKTGIRKPLDEGSRGALEGMLKKMDEAKANSGKDTDKLIENFQKVENKGELAAKKGETEQVSDLLDAEGEGNITAKADALAGRKSRETEGEDYKGKKVKDMTSEEREKFREAKSKEIEEAINYKNHKDGVETDKNSLGKDLEEWKGGKDRSAPATASSDVQELKGTITIINKGEGLLEIQVPKKGAK